MQQLGFAGGRVLEAGCGSGNFIGFAPGGARVTGVELDPVTASIAARLYPDADIASESFAGTRAPEGSFDLAIGNVPFGNFALTDGRHNPGGHSIHNHFIIKSLHLVRPGGLVAVVTSRYTMDARNPAARREIAALADLVGAVRLPSGAHQQAAGTKVITDLLIFRRREPGRDPDRTAWEQTRTAELDGVQVPVNEYFLGNPGAVLGADARHPRRLQRRRPGRRRIRGHHRGPGPRPGPHRRGRPGPRPGLDRRTGPGPRGGDRAAVPAPGRLPGSAPRRHLHPGRPGARRPVPGPRHPGRRAAAPAPASATRSPACWTPRRHPGRTPPGWTRCAGTSTGATTTTCGPTARSTGSPGGPPAAPTRTRAGRSWPASARRRAASAPTRSRPLVQALEEFDPVSQTAAKAAIFTGRVIAPRNPRLGADNGADALAICLDVLGEVRLDAIARLLGTGEDQARRELGTLVFDDPGTGGWSRPRSTCPARSATSSRPPSGPPPTTPATTSTPRNCARSSRPT